MGNGDIRKPRHRVSGWKVCLVLGCLAAGWLGGEALKEAPRLQAQEDKSPEKLAPFVPTPMVVVERMLELAGVQANDVVYDMGSGDGRIVITAAKKYGAKAVGIEIDPQLVRLARDNVKKAGVEHLVEIRQQDVLTADISSASVVTLYLFPEANMLLRPILWRQLKLGARVVSNDFDMEDWLADRVDWVLDTADGLEYTLYLWQIRERPRVSPSWSNP